MLQLQKLACQIGARIAQHPQETAAAVVTAAEALAPVVLPALPIVAAGVAIAYFASKND